MVDKDNLAEGLPQLMYTRLLVTRPIVEASDDRLNASWWDITYVAKGFWQGELNYTKYMFGGTIAYEKLLLIVKHIGVHHS